MAIQEAVRDECAGHEYESVDKSLEGERDDPGYEEYQQDDRRKIDEQSAGKQHADDESKIVPPALLAVVVERDVEEHIGHEGKDPDEACPEARKESGRACYFTEHGFRTSM